MSHLSAIAALDEPTRRRLYEFVARQSAPVGRDEAADAVQLPRTTAAFHLDKLAAEGLLEVVYERRTGRSGPGAGRPAKLYRRCPRHIAVSLPERQYELAARLLADAVAEAQETGEAPRAVLDRHAHALGARWGRESAGSSTVDEMLERHGFEPRTSGAVTSLGNCPFHSLAERHAAMVCGMTLRLLDGLLEGLAAEDVSARLEPTPGHCCVRLHASCRGDHARTPDSEPERR
ncbi:metalloregulator ArsR/SmtB family transcription factor [Allokutzneria sp. NRRL B-24872]|uniref:helix-turn-helix transcriptional regulator n=1 Tax=Allokutzneria sp. NRRL B-24872 TaxID=1137961 RepID=UPI000A388A47|nr:helix-turn-helix domain-containing protein [Allokutzneria sp. NRRL B-24872]